MAHKGGSDLAGLSLSDLISHHFPRLFIALQICLALSLSFVYSFLSFQIISGWLLCRSAQIPLPQRSHLHSSYTKWLIPIAVYYTIFKVLITNSICFAYFPVFSLSLSYENETIIAEIKLVGSDKPYALGCSKKDCLFRYCQQYGTAAGHPQKLALLAPKSQLLV